jgi:hypothetical protein
MLEFINRAPVVVGIKPDHELSPEASEVHGNSLFDVREPDREREEGVIEAASCGPPPFACVSLGKGPG